MLEIKQLTLLRDHNTLHYDLQADQGSIVSIQGRSGVGKSSLLAAIAGFVQPVSGDICWQQQSLLKQPVEKRPVSLLFQEHNLFEHLSIYANLCLGLSPEGIQQLLPAAEILQIAAHLQKKPATLSGGQRQRAALLRTLLRPEPLVLLDEPFAELDGETHQLAARWVRATAKKYRKTLLVVTHHPQDAMNLADKNIDLL